MQRILPVLLLAACERDPTFFGYWDLVEAERDGVPQEDVGFFEINDDASVSVLVRYDFVGGAFVPDPQPEVVYGDTNVERQVLFFEHYQTKGEVHTLQLAPFGIDVPFVVEEYRGDHAVLTHDGAVWPGQDDLTPLPTTLWIQR